MAHDDTKRIQNNGNGGKSLIRIEMLPAKLAYFCLEGYMGCVIPFFNIFYISLGLTATQAGLITGVSYAIAALAGPLWSCLADYSGKRKLIFIILCWGTLSTFTMPWVAQAIGRYDINITCQNGSTHNLSSINSKTQCYSTHYLLNRNTMFYAMLSVAIFSNTFFFSLPNYIDAIIINIVKTRRESTSFGVQRVTGSIGYAVANFLAGFAVDHYHPATLSRYAAAFYVFLPCILSLIPLGYILLGQAQWDVGGDENESEKRETKIEKGETKNEKRKMKKEKRETENDKVGGRHVLSHLTVLLNNRDTIIFLFTVTVSGLGFTLFMDFVFLLMDEMKSPKTISALALVGCMASELLGYPLSSKFIKRLGGPIPVIGIGIFSYLPRFVIMSYVENPWLMIPVQILHLFGVAMSWAAILEHAYMIAPKEITMTMINIVSGLQYVASGAISNLAGGIAYHTFGGRVLFRASGVFCGAWSIFMLVYYGMKYCKEKKRPVKGNVADNSHYKDIEQD